MNGSAVEGRRFEHHARREARHCPAASRSAARDRAAVLRVRPHPADWLCQRRQPSSRQGRGATAGDWHPAVAWRHPPPHRPSVVDREPAAGAGGCRGRLRNLARSARGHRQRGDDQLAARDRRHPIGSPRRGLARGTVPDRWRRHLDDVFRARPRTAGHAHRTDPDDPRRGRQGRAARTGAQFPDWPAGERVGAAADLGGGVLAKCVRRGRVRSWNADLRHRHRPDRERADPQCDRPGGDGRTIGCRRGRVVAGRGRPSRPERRPSQETGGAQRPRSRTSSSRRSSSACSISRSCGGGHSRRTSVRPISRWPSCPKRPRARCGRMPMRSARSCASTRNPGPRRGAATSRRSSRERSRWSGSSGTSQDSASHPSTRPSSTCRRMPRCQGPRSSRASTAIPNWRGRRSSID